MATERSNYDAIVVGAGPAGSTAAIRLATAGWNVALIEKNTFPRRKVCGECIAASNLPLLDALGIGTQFDALAGPELRRVGLFVGSEQIQAPLPPLGGSRHPWGRALGREHLDTLLLQRAIDAGVHVWQPWTLKQLRRDGNDHLCLIVQPGSDTSACLRAPVMIQAHGSWEPDPDDCRSVRRPRRDGDLFAFKATFHNANIAPGLLPVLAFPGGYGGMVLGDHGLTTLAFCVRRDALRALRARSPERKAALAAQSLVLAHCQGARHALANAELAADWLSVGPLQPGVRAPWRAGGTFAIGNLAGEAHPILGEGISMAIQSAWLLCDRLLTGTRDLRDPRKNRNDLPLIGRDYAAQWKRSFAPRIRFAALCAHLAMRPQAAHALLPLLRRWPTLLTEGARLGGKIRQIAPPASSPTFRTTGVQG